MKIFYDTKFLEGKQDKRFLGFKYTYYLDIVLLKIGSFHYYDTNKYILKMYFKDKFKMKIV